MDLLTQFTGSANPHVFLLFNPHATVKPKALDNGDGVGFNSMDSDSNPVSNQGWMTVKTVLVQFQTEYTPFGHFPVYLTKAQVPIWDNTRSVTMPPSVCKSMSLGS